MAKGPPRPIHSRSAASSKSTKPARRVARLDLWGRVNQTRLFNETTALGPATTSRDPRPSKCARPPNDRGTSSRKQQRRAGGGSCAAGRGSETGQPSSRVSKAQQVPTRRGPLNTARCPGSRPSRHHRNENEEAENRKRENSRDFVVFFVRHRGGSGGLAAVFCARDRQGQRRGSSRIQSPEPTETRQGNNNR